MTDLPNPAPQYKRNLVRADAGAWCPACQKRYDGLGAFSFAEEHSRATGHAVLTDYQARYRISWPGDPVTDEQMDDQSQADLAAKREPIDWSAIEGDDG